MKIIDLLNKIANGEELPKTIYYKGDNWYLEQDFSNRLPYYKNGYNMDNLLTGKEKDYFSQSLNDEVEILEEEKEIPEQIEYHHRYDECAVKDKFNQDQKGSLVDEIIIDKINEIIDYLNSKGDE